MRYIQLHPYNEYNSQELLFGGSCCLEEGFWCILIFVKNLQVVKMKEQFTVKSFDWSYRRGGEVRKWSIKILC